MENIKSFRIDHTRLLPGVYVSRVDKVGEESVTTYDLRLFRPNTEKTMTPAQAHTIEHIAATLLRNDYIVKDKVIYFGPMGCLTGFYLVMAGEPTDITKTLLRVFQQVSVWKTQIPGYSAKECGNYKLHDLDGAKKVAENYLSELEAISENPKRRKERTVYPRPKMLILTAMPEEENKIMNSLPNFIKENYDVTFGRTGIGKANAAMHAQSAIQATKPDVVLNYGYCGAFVGHCYSKGQGVSIDGAMYHDVYCGKDNNPGQVQGLPTMFPVWKLSDDELFDFVKAGLCKSMLKEPTSMAAIKENHYLLSGDMFIDSKAVADDIRRRFTFNNGHHYALVDMEGAAVAQVCYCNTIPVIIVKVISDFVDNHDTVDEHDKEYNDFKKNFK